MSRHIAFRRQPVDHASCAATAHYHDSGARRAASCRSENQAYHAARRRGGAGQLGAHHARRQAARRLYSLVRLACVRCVCVGNLPCLRSRRPRARHVRGLEGTGCAHKCRSRRSLPMSATCIRIIGRGRASRWPTPARKPIISGFEYVTSTQQRMFAANDTDLFDVTAGRHPRRWLKPATAAVNYAAAQYVQR